MRVSKQHPVLRATVLGALVGAVLQVCAAPLSMPPTPLPMTELAAFAPRLKVGDAVFIRIALRPFEEVALVTDTWTNHVGVVVDVSGPEPLIAESAFPLSRITTLSRFVARSADRRFAVTRFNDELTAGQQHAILAAARQRLGVLYDTGFDLHSRRQFCSRFVREVLQEGTGSSVGDIETFSTLLSKHPDAHVSFWKLWYFGRIPWARETVTPASVLRSPLMHPVFDGAASAGLWGRDVRGTSPPEPRGRTRPIELTRSS